MKSIKFLNRISLLFASFVFFISCNEDLSRNNSEYGYIQIKITKKGTAEITPFAVKLDNLKDAKKIEITLLKDNRDVKQTLNFLAPEKPEDAEFGMITENLELVSGEYLVKGYKIFSSKVVNGTLEVLQDVSPEEKITFSVTQGHLTRVNLNLEAKLYGYLSFSLIKDYSLINNPQTNTVSDDVLNSFDYSESKIIVLTINEQSYRFKVNSNRKDLPFVTDTLKFNAGNYKITQYQIYDTNNSCIFATDVDKDIVIKDNVLLEDKVEIKYPENHKAINDYIALYNIWSKMDGPNWSFRGQGNTIGANWVFKNRPVGEWGKQPGVFLHNNGRVKAFTIGHFNAKGKIPEDLGTLTEVESIWLGTHSENGDLSNLDAIDTYLLYKNGVDIFTNAIDIGKEYLAIKHRKEQNTPLSLQYNKDKTYKYATKKFSTSAYSSVDNGYKTNGITGLPDNIGNLKKLSALFIANNYIKDLPASFANLENLIELEIYNCSEMTQIPQVIADLPKIVTFNFSKNVNIIDWKNDLKNIFFKAGAPSPFAKTAQILFFTDNNMIGNVVPQEIENLSNAGLLDFANNKLTTFPAMGTKVSPIQFFLSNNKITSLPDDLCVLDDIETFSVSDNYLTKFPVFTTQVYDNNYVLLTLDFSYNQIYDMTGARQWPLETKVGTLNLSGNRLGEEFGKGISGTTAIKGGMSHDLSDRKWQVDFLQVSYNKIDTLTFEALKGIPKLVALECRENRLRYIPEDFHTENFFYLNGVDMSRNALERFPYELLYLSTLNQLHISDQHKSVNGKYTRTLKDWPSNIEKHFTLKVLNVSGNDLRTIYNFPANLNILDISNNPNISITIPSEICARIPSMSFQINYDKDQYIQGCPILGTNQ